MFWVSQINTHRISFTHRRRVHSHRVLNNFNEAMCHCRPFLSLISQNNRCRVRCAGGKQGTHQAEYIKVYLQTHKRTVSLASFTLCLLSFSNTANNNTLHTHYKGLPLFLQQALDFANLYTWTLYHHPHHFQCTFRPCLAVWWWNGMTPGYMLRKKESVSVCKNALLCYNVTEKSTKNFSIFRNQTDIS